VPPALRAGLVAEEVRARVLEPGEVGHAGGVARRLALLVGPGLELEVAGLDHAEAHEDDSSDGGQSDRALPANDRAAGHLPGGSNT
jgi:hypothetical protein